MESHGIITPQGRKIKETLVTVENGKGKKTIIIEDDNGVHSETTSLNASELRNIEKRKFMPGLFTASIANINTKKNKNNNNNKKKE